MASPYRNAPRKPRVKPARRRLSPLAVAIGFVWSISVVRLAVAYEGDERASFEPSLAALLSVAPPLALLRRQAREACFSDAL